MWRLFYNTTKNLFAIICYRTGNRQFQGVFDSPKNLIHPFGAKIDNRRENAENVCYCVCYCFSCFSFVVVFAPKYEK